jgi:hypothetical protein
MIKKLKSSALLFFCLAGVVLACTHVFGKKVIAINIVGPAGAEAMKAAIAAEVDAQYGNSELDVSYEEVRVMGSYNRGPLDRPIVKMCGQTFGDAVRASPTHLYSSGPIGGGVAEMAQAVALATLGFLSTGSRRSVLPRTIAGSRSTSSAGGAFQETRSYDETGIALHGNPIHPLEACRCLGWQRPCGAGDRASLTRRLAGAVWAARQAFWYVA